MAGTIVFRFCLAIVFYCRLLWIFTIHENENLCRTGLSTCKNNLFGCTDHSNAVQVEVVLNRKSQFFFGKNLSDSLAIIFVINHGVLESPRLSDAEFPIQAPIEPLWLAEWRVGLHWFELCQNRQLQLLMLLTSRPFYGKSLENVFAHSVVA